MKKFKTDKDIIAFAVKNNMKAFRMIFFRDGKEYVRLVFFAVDNETAKDHMAVSFKREYAYCDSNKLIELTGDQNEGK